MGEAGKGRSNIIRFDTFTYNDGMSQIPEQFLKYQKLYLHCVWSRRPVSLVVILKLESEGFFAACSARNIEDYDCAVRVKLVLNLEQHLHEACDHGGRSSVGSREFHIHSVEGPVCEAVSVNNKECLNANHLLRWENVCINYNMRKLFMRCKYD